MQIPESHEQVEDSDTVVEYDLSDEQISQLLNRLISTDKMKEWQKESLNNYNRWSQWIKPDVIEEMSDEELRKNFLDFYNNVWASLNPVYRDRIIRDENIHKFKDMMSYLFDESIDIEERFNQIVPSDGEYHIEGAGKGLISSFLIHFNSDKYTIWNNKSELGLTVLGRLPKREWGEDVGTTYRKIIDAIKKIRELNSKLSFLEIDHFLHIVAVEEVGKEALREVTQPSVEESRMRFRMEKYLEYFIKANFDRIDFGMNLKLYQDEESSGRQYTTAVGRIDLLAHDEEENFVVIELKKSKPSDQVIGQILRYMGWVKENLAQSEEIVKGIIIAAGSDERLRYALKMIQNVELLTYNIDFELKREK